MTRFCVQESAHNDAISDLIRQWKHLCFTECDNIVLNIDALSHLSHLPNLQRVSLRMQDAVVNQIQEAAGLSDSILILAALRDLIPHGPSLDSVKKLFHHSRSPVLHALHVRLDTWPAASELTSFLAGIRESTTHALFDSFTLYVRGDDNGLEVIPMADSPRYFITLDDFQPLTAFVNLKLIEVGIPCCIDLDERGLFALASSRPHLDTLTVSDDYSWMPSSGITPGGFLQLLILCRSLRPLCFMFDTRGYTEIPQGDPWHGSRMRAGLSVHPLYAPIEEASVDALAVFFSVASHPFFSLAAYQWEVLWLTRRLHSYAGMNCIVIGGRGLVKWHAVFGRNGRPCGTPWKPDPLCVAARVD